MMVDRLNNSILNMMVIAAVVFLVYKPALAEPWLSPGDMLIRSDLQLLSDVGLLQVPLTTWPLSLANINDALQDVDVSKSNPMVLQSLQRIRYRLATESNINKVKISSAINVSSQPSIMRTFEDKPRTKGEVGGGISWVGERFAINAQGRRVSSPLDNESFRPDGSYIGAAVGNWMLAAGYQERWWGPGWDGSLILSTNARPGPQVSIQRNRTMPFNSDWLRWIGPWSMTSFFEKLNDERVVQDAILFGLRVTVMPVEGLEIGLSRTAQWCGSGRPCGASTFVDLLLGHDNVGVNIEASQEPGNQLGGIDVRWTSPIGDSPYATYLQWIGEDTRQGGPQIGSWIRQLGVEFWGLIPGLNFQHRSHIEWADTMCREGGIGLSKKKPGCAYNHGRVYETGYRYHGESIGHGIDTDSLSSSIGSTLIDPQGNSVSLLARYIELNREAQHNPLSSVAEEIAEVSVSYNRQLDLGMASIGVVYSRRRGSMVDASSRSDIEWWVGFQKK